MAYTHNQRNILVSAANAMLSSAASAFWAPGYTPFVLRAVSVVVTTVVTDVAAVVTITKRVTAGSNTNEETIDTITVPTTAALGDVLYVDGLNVEVNPGEELEFAGGGQGTAGAGHICIFGEDKWEHPDNNSDMTESA